MRLINERDWVFSDPDLQELHEQTLYVVCLTHTIRPGRRPIGTPVQCLSCGISLQDFMDHMTGTIDALEMPDGSIKLTGAAGILAGFVYDSPRHKQPEKSTIIRLDARYVPSGFLC